MDVVLVIFGYVRIAHCAKLLMSCKWPEEIKDYLCRRLPRLRLFGIPSYFPHIGNMVNVQKAIKLAIGFGVEERGRVKAKFIKDKDAEGVACLQAKWSTGGIGGVEIYEIHNSDATTRTLVTVLPSGFFQDSPTLEFELVRTDTGRVIKDGIANEKAVARDFRARLFWAGAHKLQARNAAVVSNFFINREILTSRHKCEFMIRVTATGLGRNGNPATLEAVSQPFETVSSAAVARKRLKELGTQNKGGA